MNEKSRKILPPVPTKPSVSLMKLRDELTSQETNVAAKPDTDKVTTYSNTTANDNVADVVPAQSVFSFVPYTPLEATTEFRRNPFYNGKYFANLRFT